MRQILTTFAFVVGFFCWAEQAKAKGGQVGLGLVAEDPSGLTLKIKLSEQQALDFRLGLDGFVGNALLIQGNYLFSLFDLVNSGGVDLSLYVGGGLTLGFFDLGANEVIVAVGRVPIGLDMEFSAAPIDIFAEIALELVLVSDFFVDGAVGIRFFF